MNPQTIERFVKRFAPYGLRSEALCFRFTDWRKRRWPCRCRRLVLGMKVDRIERERIRTEGRAVVGCGIRCGGVIRGSA